MAKITTVIFDFSRVLLYPKDPQYAGKLNDLYKDVKTKAPFLFFDHFTLDNTLLDWLETKKNTVKLCLYTSEIIQNDPAIFPRLEQTFDKNIFSAEDFGWSKRNPENYLDLAKKIEVLPENIVFVDDTIENVKAAQGAGLTTIQFFSREHIIEKLSAVLSQ
ncbi:MAG: HAD-IA family hydrolase [Candidatus Woesebacteria bacterium]